MDLSRIVNIAIRIARSPTASITFWSDSDAIIDEIPESCLCTQNLEMKLSEIDEMLRSNNPEEVEEIKNKLEEYAHGDCRYCGGSGVHITKVRRETEINLSNSNAMAILEVLGIKPDYDGSISLPEAKRALMKAKSRSSLKKFERPEEILTRPREIEEGVTELHSPYFYGQGLSESDIKERLEKFEKLIKEAEANGAKNILWG